MPELGGDGGGGHFSGDGGGGDGGGGAAAGLHGLSQAAHIVHSIWYFDPTHDVSDMFSDDVGEKNNTMMRIETRKCGFVDIFWGWIVWF